MVYGLLYQWNSRFLSFSARFQRSKRYCWYFDIGTTSSNCLALFSTIVLSRCLDSTVFSVFLVRLNGIVFCLHTSTNLGMANSQLDSINELLLKVESTFPVIYSPSITQALKIRNSIFDSLVDWPFIRSKFINHLQIKCVCSFHIHNSRDVK